MGVGSDPTECWCSYKGSGLRHSQKDGHVRTQEGREKEEMDAWSPQLSEYKHLLFKSQSVYSVMAHQAEQSTWNIPQDLTC